MKMIKPLVFILFIIFSVSINAETVYKKTNPDGSIEFTDKESVDSEAVKIRKPTSFAPVRVPVFNLPTKKLSPKYNYSLSITQPTNDSTIVGKEDVVVSISVQPSIKSTSYKFLYQLAGQSITSRNTSEIFKNVNRGTHNLTVSIVDRNGNVVTSASNIIYMKRFFIRPKKP